MSASKYCSKCDKTKSVDQFSKNRNRSDGLQSWCKKCKRDAQRIYAQTERGKAMKKKYQQSVKGKVARRQYILSAAGKAMQRCSSRQHREKYPERIKACSAVSGAVRRGRMPHVSTRRCENCGKQAEQYHHPNYSKPLVVVPLCHKCHEALHTAQVAKE